VWYSNDDKVDAKTGTQYKYAPARRTLRLEQSLIRGLGSGSQSNWDQIPLSGIAPMNRALDIDISRASTAWYVITQTNVAGVKKLTIYGISEQEYNSDVFQSSLSGKKLKETAMTSDWIDLPNGARVKLTEPFWENANSVSSCPKTVSIVGGTGPSSETICGSGNITASKLKFIAPSAGGVQQEDWNWEVKLVQIQTNTDLSGVLAVVPDTPSSNPVIANGVPQRKTGKFTVRAENPPQGTGAVSTGGITAITFANNAFTITTTAATTYIVEVKEDGSKIPSSTLISSYTPQRKGKVYFAAKPITETNYEADAEWVCTYTTTDNKWTCVQRQVTAPAAAPGATAGQAGTGTGGAAPTAGAPAAGTAPATDEGKLPRAEARGV
jgi:hypothetical protein